MENSQSLSSVSGISTSTTVNAMEPSSRAPSAAVKRDAQTARISAAVRIAPPARLNIDRDIGDVTIVRDTPAMRRVLWPHGMDVEHICYPQRGPSQQSLSSRIGSPREVPGPIHYRSALGAHPPPVMAEKVPGFDTPFYRRFLNQKGGIANVFFTACVCVLSVRVMSQRAEHETEVNALNRTIGELRGEIDRLKNRGWFGFGGGDGATGKVQSKKDAPRAEPEPRKAKATKAPKKGGEKVLI